MRQNTKTMARICESEGGGGGGGGALTVAVEVEVEEAEPDCVDRRSRSLPGGFVGVRLQGRQLVSFLRRSTLLDLPPWLFFVQRGVAMSLIWENLPTVVLGFRGQRIVSALSTPVLSLFVDQTRTRYLTGNGTKQPLLYSKWELSIFADVRADECSL